MNIRLQEHSSNCLIWHIKGKAKQASELVKFSQCEDAIRLKRVIVV